MTYERRTLAQPVRLNGLGLHTGVPVEVRFTPGESGVRFAFEGDTWLASPENVTDTTRSTRVGQVGTVEHLMSALAGLEITDLDVELTAPELPGLDGSAADYVSEFTGAGFQSLGQIEIPELFSRVFIQEDAVKVAVSKGRGHWRFDYNTGDRWPHLQTFQTEAVHKVYGEEIAPARTFALAEEIPHLIQSGLGQGLDEHSALILGLEDYKNDPRFPDEPARHKLLDLIGDLYLSGVPIRALNVVAERSGHRANVKVAQMLKQAVFGG